MLLLSMPKIYGKIKFIPNNFNGSHPFAFGDTNRLFPAANSVGSGSDLVMNLEQLETVHRHADWVVRFPFPFFSDFLRRQCSRRHLPADLVSGCHSGSPIWASRPSAIFDFGPAIFAAFHHHCDGRAILRQSGKAPLTAILLVTEMVGGLNQLTVTLHLFLGGVCHSQIYWA